MENVISIGHKNPDTDSVVSAIIFCELLKKMKKQSSCFCGLAVKPARGGELNKETIFVLKHFKQPLPSLVKSIKNKKVILVDHGDYEQALEGVQEAEIIGIIDHHKISGIKTSKPIFYRNEPLGSTSTILAKMFLENNFSFDKKTSGLLLAGVLSDTLNLSSPTTTSEDKKIIMILNNVAKQNISSLSKKMFEEKSDIKGISPDKIVGSDYKEFQSGNTRFGIGVWETVNTQKVKEMKDKILSSLNKLKLKQKTDLMFFSLVDILKKNSEIFIIGNKEKMIAEKVFKKRSVNNLLFLSGVVSRKKEILPPLLKFLEKNKLSS